MNKSYNRPYRVKKNISGVYWIKNIKTEERYIGSSIDIRRRWKEHFRVLKRNEHDAQPLQDAWNKYGKWAFVWRLVAIVSGDRAAIYVKEQEYLDSWFPTGLLYNEAQTADCFLYPSFYNILTSTYIPSGRNLMEMCQERGLNYQDMGDLKHGNIQQTQDGWRLADF